ncbi:MAG: SURF1 family protein [Methylococcales bacterium]|nr:SURF1 family protein [Methylococcales bacterium]
MLLSRIFLLLLPTLALALLGFWQLGRGQEKAALLAQIQQSQTAEVLQLADTYAINLTADRYRPVRLHGHYQANRQILLDNQLHQGRAGFLVLTPFVLQDSANVVLVNRGWIPWPARREQQPDISLTEPVTTLTGRINRFPDVGIRLQGATEPSPGWPSRVGVIDPERLARHLEASIAPFQIELAPAEPQGYLRDWHTPMPMPPEKHQAYAVQWFGLALTWPVLLTLYRRRKHS